MPRFPPPYALAAAVLAFNLLAGAAPALAKDAPEPVAVDADFKPAEQARKVFSTAYPEALKGVKRVAVPLFTVEFIIADNVSAQTSGFAAAGRASASAHYKLLGVGEPDFQALTDAAYQGFVRDLQAGGIEVVPQAQVAAAPSYAKLVASGSASPIKGDSALTLAPAGMAIYGLNKVASGGGGVFGAFSAFGGAVAAIGAVGDTVALQKELGDATVLEVQLRLHFVRLSNHNKGFFGRLASDASVSGKAYPSITTAVLGIQVGPARGSLTLQNPLALDPAAIAEVREEPTTAGDVAGAVVVGLLRFASGSSDSSSSTRLQAVADPARYRQVVGAGLDTVHAMFVQRLRAGD